MKVAVWNEVSQKQKDLEKHPILPFYRKKCPALSRPWPIWGRMAIWGLAVGGYLVGLYLIEPAVTEWLSARMQLGVSGVDLGSGHFVLNIGQ